MRAALAPYGWQRLSTEMLARHAVAALDRHCVERELAPLFGTFEGTGEAEPAACDDERVLALTRGLRECRCRALTLTAVCRHAIAVLESWHHERAWLDIELAWLLDRDG